MLHLLRDARHTSAGRYALALIVLVVLLAGTWVLRAWHVDRAEATVEQRIERSVNEALDFVERDLRNLQRSLLRRAEAVAEDENVIRSLRAYERDSVSQELEPVVQSVRGEDLPERMALSVYDTEVEVLAWNRFTMPPGDIVRAPDFRERTYVTVARDGDVRRALSVWVPIRDGMHTVGHARAMYLLGQRTPVQNRYLSDYSRTSDWWRHTGLTVRFAADPPAADADLPRNERRIVGEDGRALGRIIAEEPSQDEMVASVADRYDAVLALWVTLLLAWAIAGLWYWYRRTSGRPWSMAMRFGVLAVAWWGVRYLLLALDVPGRWQQPRAPLAPLFDPSHFASTLGNGLMRSAGDFVISALFALAFAFVLLGLVRGLIRHVRKRGPAVDRKTPSLDWQNLLAGIGSAAGGIALVLIGAAGLAQVVRHALRDSTLDYFTTAGLLPDPLVLTIFCTLLITALAFVFLAVAVIWITAEIVQRTLPPSTHVFLVAGITVLLVTAGIVTLPGATWYMVVGVVFIVAGAAWIGDRYLGPDLDLLSLRSVLLTVVVLAILLYPMFYSGMHEQRQVQMLEAASQFEEGQDPRAVFAVEQLLQEANNESELRNLMGAPQATLQQRAIVDSLAASLLQNSLLASLGRYDVSLTVFDRLNRPQGRHDTPGTGASRSMLDRADTHEFRILRQMYEEALAFGPRVEQITGRREPDRFQYAGIIPIRTAEGWDPFEDPVGWVMVRAEPRATLVGETTPFPRVLLPGASEGDITRQISMAEFRDGQLVRSLGPSFGRHQLAPEIRDVVASEGEVWRSEQAEDQQVLTLYRFQPRPSRPISFPGVETGPNIGSSILAVRVPAIGIFDHLYYLLRLTVAGFVVALPFYLLGLFLRWQAGLLPAPYVRFRDRALNAFLIVGIIAVVAVGFVGQRVIVAEADNAVKGWLRQHLERIEEALAQEAEGNEMPYHVIDRVSTDDLAARAGVDLNIYRDGQLVSTNRPQLVRDRLIDERLPADVYHALYYDGYRLRFSEEHLGTFRYMAGYYALPDEQGAPRYVVSVPTLPEQERLEQERARTIAYLFGALLLLILTVMLTAGMLAGALARPIARLRAGLEDVAKGRFEQTIQVDTRDEIGELVETFNTMQGQLADSRRKLAQQERQLAWREMARQVAHEIKNPLTPMKLSVQNLRRAFEDAELRNGTLHPIDEPERVDKFANYFDRVTSTLIEQINTLARIADEFSTFARLPQRVLERLDLNAVIREAVSLMQAEATIDIALDLHPEPLVIEADREEVRRVFINLIKNALQAVSDEKDAHVVITSEPVEDRTGCWAACAVTDNGKGIAPGVRDRIFEPNFSTKTSGTGLGLPIVKKSIEDMAGTVSFETEAGEGTTFFIRLPLAGD